MRVKVILIGLVFLFCFCEQSIFAKHSITPSKHLRFQMIAQEELIGSFKVKSGRLVVVKGKLEDCQEDNRYVVATLKQQKVELKNLEYEVAVKKLVTQYQAREGNFPLTVFEYIIDRKPGKSNQAYDRLVKQVRTTYISVSDSFFEAPGTCFYLEKQGKLVLLSHYGNPNIYQGFKPDALIDWVRKEQL